MIKELKKRERDEKRKKKYGKKLKKSLLEILNKKIYSEI